MTDEEKLTKQGKQLSARVTELVVQVKDGNETVADLKIKLNAAGRRVEDDACERDSLQACLQLS